MRFFDKDGKYNWVDENNVVIGYDNYQDCCEHASYYYTTEEPEFVTVDMIDPAPINLPEEVLLNYRIDPTFFKHLTEEKDSYALDGGDAVLFKLISETEKSIYLVLFNSHNGYYGHGFEMQIGGLLKQSGVL